MGIFFLQKGERVSSVVAVNIILILGLYILFLIIELVFFSCPLTEGIFFFPLFVIPAVVFSLSLSSIVIIYSKWKSILLLLLIYISLIIYSLVEYYFEPQLFLFNPLVIYFPGLVYNEIFSIDHRILLYTTGLLLASFLILLPKILEEKNKKIFELSNYHFYVPVILIFSFLFIFSDEMGLSTSQQFLKSKFPERIIEQDFEIFIQDKNITDAQKKLLEYKTQFHLNQLEKIFGYKTSKIQIFIFDSDTSKKQLLGDEVADFTKPWLKQIFVTQNSFDQTIKHELAHIFLGERTKNLFKVAAGFNLGLIEGGAMAIEWDWLENTPDYYAAMIRNYSPELDFEQFFNSYSFATQKSSLSYIISGSFSNYLIKKYGLEKFLKFYSDGNFFKVYNSDLKTELNDFQKILNRYEFNVYDSLKVKVLFGGQTLFERKCPRAINRIKFKAKKFLAQKSFAVAEDIFKKIYLRTKDIDAFTNLVRLKFLQRKFNEVIATCNESEYLNSLNGFNSIYLRIYYSLSLARTGEKEKALKLINELKSLNISSSWNVYFDLILFLIEKSDLIEKMTGKNFRNFLIDLKTNFPNESSVLVNDIDNLSSEQLSKVTETYSNNFWILKECFYRYLMLGNFVKANSVIETLKINFSNFNNPEKYQFDLMIFVFEKFKKEAKN